MKIYNPSIELGGETINLEADDIVIRQGETIIVSKEMGEELLKQYKFLKDLDNKRLSPDWHTRKPLNMIQRLWARIIQTKSSDTQ